MANKKGRPRVQWSEEKKDQFTKLCSIFCTKKEICSIMGIGDHRTLDRLIEEYFPETPTWEEAFELYSGNGKASIRRKQFELAINGDRTMLIWLGKNYLNQSENGTHAADSTDGEDNADIATASKTGDIRSVMVAARNKVAAQLDVCASGRDVAALSKQLMDINREIAALDGGNIDAEYEDLVMKYRRETKERQAV